MPKKPLFVIMGIFMLMSIPTLASAHISVRQQTAHVLTVKAPATFCSPSGDSCDGLHAATMSCGTSSRVSDTPMLDHNGATVGHLYLYTFSSSVCFVFWGTFHLSAAITNGLVWTTRSQTTDDPKEFNALYTNPSVGVYHDAQVLGCDADYPNGENFNAALDWKDIAGVQLHTQTENVGCA